MKTELLRHFLAAGAGLSLLIPLCYRTVAAAPGGDKDDFSGWSAPEEIGVPAAKGPVRLLWRTQTIEAPDAGGVTKFKVHRVVDPIAKELWLGEPADSYMVVGQKIWGFIAVGEVLRLRQSEHYGNSPEGEERLVREFASRFETNALTTLKYGASVKQANLGKLFGSKAISLSAQWRMDMVVLKNASLSADGVTVKLKTIAGKELSLTFDADANIVAAARDGEAVPILLEPFVPPKELTWWQRGGDIRIPSVSGPVSAAMASFSAPRDMARPMEQWVGASAWVVKTTGDVWIGPSGCMPALFADRFIAVRVDGGHELQIFAGPRARVPLFADAGRAFRGQLADFEREFRGRNFQWQPDYRTNIFEVFGDREQWPAGCQFYMRSVLVREDTVAAILTSDRSGAHPELVFDKELKLISARILPSSAPEIGRPTLDQMEFRGKTLKK